MTQSVPMNNNIFPSKLNARHVEGFSELRLLSLVTEGRSVCSSAHLPGFLSRVRVCQSVYLSICLPVLLIFHLWSNSRPEMEDGNLAINHLLTLRKKCTDLGPCASTRGE